MVCYVPALTEKDPQKQNLSLQQLASGRSNAVGTITLTASATTSTMTDPNCAAGSVPILVPTTAHAAAEIGNGTMFISNVSNKSFTVTHASNTQVDRSYLYVLVG